MRLRNLSLGATLPNKFPRQNQERDRSSSSKSKVPCKAGTHSFYGFSDSNKPRWNPSSHEHQSFWMAPFLENRNGQAINQNNPAATTLKRRLQCKRCSTQSSSKISSLDIFCLFSSFSSTIVHSFTERDRKLGCSSSFRIGK